ncbi:hypothetical protein FB388_3584 [Pseudonocardia cypriaca]|uniref:Uncharacterized protein n=1 Tax=Pseudonocardia cypriaca TaxID=882449 RepID=A0A543GJB4_9PSEU|nr:hypothetical protein FB388_3584 [Pseudonocardia cypriaca]
MPVLLVAGVIGLVAAVLATGLVWPGWMRQEIAGTASAVVDRSTPEGTARGVTDALNRRDVRKFVDQLVCRDGRTLTEDGDMTLAEETLYRDIEPFDPRSDAPVAAVDPVFAVEEVRDLRPSDPGYDDEMAGAKVAIVTVSFASAPPEVRQQLPDRKGALTMVDEDGAWVVCVMGFAPVGELSGEVPPDADPASPTGRAQAFIAAVNAGDQADARIYMCSTAREVDEFVKKAIADGAQLRLNAPVDTFGDGDASVQIWHTVGGQERRAPGFMKQEPDGWCVFALALQGG